MCACKHLMWRGRADCAKAVQKGNESVSAARPMTLFSHAVPVSSVLRDLRAAGFDMPELLAVRRTPAMWRQLERFYRQGGRIERVDANFSGANSSPGCIRFYGPPAPAVSAYADFGTLAHELGHALFCPEQWREIGSFASAQEYARSRELGEAYAWLNQYRLCRRKLGGKPERRSLLEIENDHDFGRQTIDIFMHIAACEAAGWNDTDILDELATLNANMFPCGMGVTNRKTYGQCNRWDYLLATRERHAAFDGFLRGLSQAPSADVQKVLMKFNLFTQADAPRRSALDWFSARLVVTEALPAAKAGSDDGLQQLYGLASQAFPTALPGVEQCSVPLGGGAQSASA